MKHSMIPHKVYRLLAIFTIVMVLIPQVNLVSWAKPLHQDADVSKLAEILLKKMTPQERVGQLFLVTFKGRQVTPESQIYDLIVRHHVGGVVLRAANDNFVGPENTIREAYSLNSQLQKSAWEASTISLTDSITKTSYTPQYVPLFIGISQEGDGYPYDQILNGLTPLPNQMAIGATWKPELARSTGIVLGQELQRLGFNLLLGPSLDVLDVVQTGSGEDLGTRTFGGDPYWVGEMGKAYIGGLHYGSAQRLAVIAKHFPGRGGSDRQPDEEIATVRKSLEQLKQIELAPFFAVTGNAPNGEMTTDGLLVSHIRYQGFQGNIRATTRPVSFDSAAFDQLMSLPAFSTWREGGGIVISDDLGSQAVRRFYDITGQFFDARQVARNAFLAGNDILYVGNFISSGDPDSYTTIVKTLELFTQKYIEDAEFAERVDTSVKRILTLKYRLYGYFEIENVIPGSEGLDEIGKSQQISFEIAKRAVTLISPSLPELATTLPNPPTSRERIVFLTDALPERQCSQCVEQYAFPVDGLQKAVIRLYGPQIGGQVLQYRLSSYSFADLWGMLNGIPDLPPIEDDLRAADWIVFALLNVQQSRPESLALRRFLSDRPDLFNNKKVVAFAFNAPYYLDATDISKLSAYYGIYSKSPAFIDLAARVLFQELKPAGASPVSIPGVGYDLITAMSPDPSQVIPLFLDLPDSTGLSASNATLTATAEPTKIVKFSIGDVLPLRTGIIYDHNYNPVPDGTVVRFLFSDGGKSEVIQQIETVTSGGVARASYRIQNQGVLEIRAVSDPALTSEIIRLDVTNGPSAVTEIAPTVVPTATPENTKTATPVIEPTEVSENIPLVKAQTAIGFLSIFLVWLGAFGTFQFARRKFSLRLATRCGLCVVIGGFTGYLLLALFFPNVYHTSLGIRVLSVVFGMSVGGAVGFWQCYRSLENKRG